MNNFDKKIEEAIEKIAKGKILEEVVLEFPKNEQGEARIALEAAEKLFFVRKEISPNKEKFREYITHIPYTIFEEKQKNNNYHFLPVSFKMRAWQIFAPVGVMTALFLLVFLNGAHEKNNNEQKIAENSMQNKLSTSTSEIASFSSVIPEATGNTNDIISALLTDMNQETAALNTEINTATAAVTNESNAFDNFSIPNETGI